SSRRRHTRFSRDWSSDVCSSDLPPVVRAAAFSIRKRPAAIWSLADYVQTGVMTGAQAQALKAAVVERGNILISGGTGSGKTTLEIGRASCRERVEGGVATGAITR